MHFQLSSVAAATILVLAPTVKGHMNILSVQGLAKTGSPAGPVGMVLGLDPSTPRTGAAIDPNQRDVTIFNQKAVVLWNGCGQSILNGVHNPATLIPKLVQKGQLAQVLAGGQLQMVVHQVNGDGNGPFQCYIDTACTAGRGSFTKQATIAKQVPGQSPILNAIVTQQFPFVVNIPADLKCTGSFGSKSNVCLMRCQNNAINGPFGGCIPFEIVTNLRASFKEKREESEKGEHNATHPHPHHAGDKKKGEHKLPEKAAASDDQIDANFKDAIKDIPTGVQKRDDDDAPTPTTTSSSSSSSSSSSVAMSDVMAALTEGDAVPASLLSQLSATVAAAIATSSLPPKLVQQAKAAHTRNGHHKNKFAQKWGKHIVVAREAEPTEA
ncbi:hypothetical protein TWF694_008136 [Orbilia ellipsospora]|uniref:Uncharacterized protein n=1 Tax=Orbilia ellipsospora TaxID=2528407 RepID=A0AAV9XF60_9PEZI